MEILSRIVWNVDTTEEAAQLERQLLPHLCATRGDSIEIRHTQRQLNDVTGDVEVMVYVIVYTGNLRGMMLDLEEANLI